MIRVTQCLAPARQARCLSAITSYEPPKSPRKGNTNESRHQDFGFLVQVRKIRSKIGLGQRKSNTTETRYPTTAYQNQGFLRQFYKIAHFFGPGPGVGAVTLREGEVLYMKLSLNKESNVKSIKRIFTWHYLVISQIAAFVVTSNLFMFDIICAASVLASAAVLNGIFHVRHKKNVLEIVKLPDDKICVKSVTFYGGTKTGVYKMSECQLGDMQEFVKIGGEEMCISWPDVGRYNPDDEFYETYLRREKVLLHAKHISPFKEIDGVKFSEDLFGKDKQEPEFVKKAIDEVKLSEAIMADSLRTQTISAKMDDL